MSLADVIEWTHGTPVFLILGAVAMVFGVYLVVGALTPGLSFSYEFMAGEVSFVMGVAVFFGTIGFMKEEKK